MSLTIINPFVFAAGGGGGAETFFILGTISETTTSTTVQTGFRFTANANIDLIGLRARVGSSGVELTLRLWRVSDETLLGSCSVNAAGGATWVSGYFSSPVALANGADYIITLRRTDGGSTSVRREAVADVTFNSSISYVTTVYEASDTYPNDGTLTEVRGFVDGIYLS